MRKIYDKSIWGSIVAIQQKDLLGEYMDEWHIYLNSERKKSRKKPGMPMQEIESLASKWLRENGYSVNTHFDREYQSMLLDEEHVSNPE